MISVHNWPCPVLSAKEMRSMKAGSACDQGKIDQKREYISVNGEAAFSSLQTMW